MHATFAVVPPSVWIFALLPAALLVVAGSFGLMLLFAVARRYVLLARMPKARVLMVETRRMAVVPESETPAAA